PIYGIFFWPIYGSMHTSLDYSSPKSQISVVPAAQSCASRNPACTLLGPPPLSVMLDLVEQFQPETTDFGRSSGAKLRFTKPRLRSAGLTISVGQRISFPNSAHGPGRPFDGLLRCGLFQFPGHQQHQQHAAEQADPGPFEGGGGVADEACQQGHEG